MRRTVAALILSAAATTAIAQQTPDEVQPVQVASPQTGLNIPDDVKLFANDDQTVRKPTAIINGEIITRTDVEQRLALIVTANGGNVPAEEMERLRLQVLRNLIDETLQIQEARANEIEVTPQEIEQSYERVAQNFKRTPDQMNEFLRTQGSSAASIKRQIQGELAWSRLLRRRIEPTTAVSDAEVQAIMDRLQAAKGASEYRVGEIYLSATPETVNEAAQNARKIMEQVSQGGSFTAYARQFSEASTAAVGGDLGWVRAAQLPESLSNALQGMTVGQLAGPIEVPGGISILYLIDQRQVLTADPRDATLNLRQLAIAFPAGTTQEQASARAAQFANATRSIAGCGSAEKVAQELGAELVDNDQVRIRDLPVQLQQTLIDLQVGQATPPFGSVSDGVRVLVLCGRDDPQVADGPSFERIMAQLEEQRVNLRARRYLRDLRRDAVVDYR
jgi:peptidyl-prolyl cis-trans isomerase SurA